METGLWNPMAKQAVTWSIAYEEAAGKEQRAISDRKKALMEAGRQKAGGRKNAASEHPIPHASSAFHEKQNAGSEACRDAWGEEALRALWEKAKQDNRFLAMPFAAMLDTSYGKKSHYYEMTKVWEECEALDQGWALLALANTLEQMSPAIYEHYRAMADRFRDAMKAWLSRLEAGADIGEAAGKDAETDADTGIGEPEMDRALAALALLKACRMEILPCANYAARARQILEHDAAGFMEQPSLNSLAAAACAVWKQIRLLWGAEANQRFPGCSDGMEKGKERGEENAEQDKLEQDILDQEEEQTEGPSLTVLHKTARSVVLELPGDDIYETEEYEIWVNGTHMGKDCRMVTIIDGLRPQTRQRIELRRKDGRVIRLETETPYEYVTLNVRRFGAKGDGIADDTAAIQTAILSCPKDSRVYIPEGIYRIRNLFLKSDLVLEIGEGAVLKGFQEREAFPILPGRTESFDGTGEYILGTWEGNPLPSMASLINGIHVENVVICGKGTIDGGGNFETWWVDGINSYPPYRPKMMFFSHCRNITVQGIRVQNSPCWNLHPYFSEKIRVYGITLQSPDRSHNTDGIDPESCRDVEIAGVFFSVGDDCIAIKSGKIYMGKTYQRPSREIRIRQCLMEKGHGAVTIGSEIAGGVLDVSVTKCLFRDTDRGLRIKTRRGRGKDSVVDGISFDTVVMDQVKAPFVVNSFYFCDPDGRSDYVASQEALPVDDRTPQIKKLMFSHIICRNAHYTGACIYGLPEQKVEEVVMNEVYIFYAPDAKEGIAAMMRECTPTCRQGILARNIKRLVLKEVHLEGAKKELEWEGVDEIITG